jgi:hypothetical protein
MKSFKQFIKEQNEPISKPRVFIYPNGQGSDVSDKIPSTKPSSIPVNSALGNEPFKDDDFFKSPEKKGYMEKMTSDIKSGKKMPPTLSISHPADPSKNIIVDGNHRLAAHINAGVENMRTQQLSHDDIHIMPNDYGEKNKGIPLSSFKEEDGSYDMEKPRDNLGGKSLNHYFVSPDGSHNF